MSHDPASHSSIVSDSTFCLSNRTIAMERLRGATQTVLGRSSTIAITLLIQAYMLTSSHQVDAKQISHQSSPANSADTLLQDPIVWDLNSLYEPAKSPHLMSNSRHKRSAGGQQPRQRDYQPSAGNQQQVVDACQSKMEVVTPYYATNSKGKLRTIVNSELMQQAIQVETCIRLSSSANQGANQSAGKCNSQPDCGCEQKYKWHRLLVFDQSDHRTSTSKGLFMDWFLFPSNCVCRCRTSSTKQFIKTISQRRS